MESVNNQIIQKVESEKKLRGPYSKPKKYQVYIKQYDGSLHDMGIFASQQAIANKLCTELNEKFTRSSIDNIIRGSSLSQSKWIKITRLS